MSGCERQVSRVGVWFDALCVALLLSGSLYGVIVVPLQLTMVAKVLKNRHFPSAMHSIQRQPTFDIQGQLTGPGMLLCKVILWYPGVAFSVIH